MQKRTIFCIVKFAKTQQYKKEVPYMKNITNLPTMKELEQITFRALQNSFSKVMAETLSELDQWIAENRDKKRFYLKDKRLMQFESVFGLVEVKRNYYYDQESKKYVYLLDQYMSFEGSKGMSPVVQDMAIELAVTGVSYRQASAALETLLGYTVVSHEGIRQQVLQTEIIPTEPIPLEKPVLFVEVDGLYTKSQEKGRKGREIKIASVHQGWKMNGKRAKLIGKRHFIHTGKQPFWEEFEQFLMDTYEYDATKHHLVINGDGANWITACRDYFRTQATFVIDRFHVAKDIRSIFHKHRRYRTIREKLAAYDYEGFMVELNSAVGTLENESKEKHLEEIIAQLSKYPEALGDYREKLKKMEIATEGFRPMGSAEGTMSVFAKRIKHGRSWCKMGLDQFLGVFVALKDNLTIRTLKGVIEPLRTTQDTKALKRTTQKVTKRAEEATRQNIPYLNGVVGKPITAALKGLVGF